LTSLEIIACFAEDKSEEFSVKRLTATLEKAGKDVISSFIWGDCISEKEEK
jgi:hypothetical protein